MMLNKPALSFRVSPHRRPTFWWAGVIALILTHSGCHINPVDQVAHEMKAPTAFGIYFPDAANSGQMLSFSIHQAELQRSSNSRVTRYETNQPLCAESSSQAAQVYVYCLESTKGERPRLDRYKFLSSFITQGYMAIRRGSPIPAVGIDVVEVSPSVTITGYDLRRDVHYADNRYHVTFFLPWTDTDDISGWLGYSQAMFHELIHLAIYSRQGLTEQPLTEEFVAEFIAAEASKILVYPKVVSNMAIGPAGSLGVGFETNVRSIKNRVNMFQRKRENGNYFHASKNPYWAVPTAARDLFWMAFKFSGCDLEVFESKLTQFSRGLIRDLDRVHSLVDQLLESRINDGAGTTTKNCQNAISVSTSGSTLEDIRLKFSNKRADDRSGQKRMQN